MPYIGRSTDGFGVRNRFLFVASANDTSVSGADANGATLTFTDGAYVDVYLNGVLLKAGTDYNTNTANTIAGLSALSANDEVTVIVYDVFTVADTVSATSGGTFNGNITISSTDSGSSINPDLILHRNSASPADNDQLGQLVFRGRNDNSEDVEYARIRSQSLDVSDGTEDGKLNINVMNNGSMQGRMDFRGGQPTRLFNADVEINDGYLYFKDAGKGIVLGATSNTDANTLEDYEEGTWTATATGFGGTFSASDEQYVKVGRMVHFDCVLSFSGTDSDRVQIAGLPFTSTNTSAVVSFFSGSAFSDLKLLVSGTTIFGSNTSGDATYTSVSGMTARFSGTYMASA